MLAGLEAVHARGLLHRDLKPSNVFLTPHGVKLLDFGLARPVTTSAADASQTLPGLTLPGVVMGTPSYMAPEQVLAQPIDQRTDLYALGTVLFEMLSGAPPFQAPTPAETLARIVSERPPALGGSALVSAVDRVVHRALARVPDERYPDAASMAQDLRAALRVADSGGQMAAQPIRRLIVLPFRLLRVDPEIDFLAFGLADAIAASLMGESRLVVRSSLAAARYAAGVPDVATLAAETDVDLVMTGTLLKSGDQIRVTAQLAEAPRGTLLWTHTHQARLTDFFQVQDDIVRQVCGSVSASLGTRAPVQAPRGRAHELYLRANQLALDPRKVREARGCYEEAVEEDPSFAPAWARLGRVYRVLAKDHPTHDPENFTRADRALKRALELDPELTMALTYYAQLEMDMGRSRDALVRLLERALRRPSDPYLLAGLVQAARYLRPRGGVDCGARAGASSRSANPHRRGEQLLAEGRLCARARRARPRTEPASRDGTRDDGPDRRGHHVVRGRRGPGAGDRGGGDCRPQPAHMRGAVRRGRAAVPGHARVAHVPRSGGNVPFDTRPRADGEGRFAPWRSSPAASSVGLQACRRCTT